VLVLLLLWHSAALMCCVAATAVLHVMIELGLD
jgi:hypothetical protein